MWIGAAALLALELITLPPGFGWADSLPAIPIGNVNTLASGRVRLYDDHGAVEPVALADFNRVAATKDQPGAPALSPRLVQLVVKAAYHFHAKEISVISGFRPQTPWKGSRHATGEALDFRLTGVRARDLAVYLRTLARVGVGLYTHPRTQYVHLDVRDESFHWLDGSPPGVTWREQGIRDWGRAKRDGAYRPEDDLPVP
jgi:uncharacterized protein YcbK (DUF882 family)